MIGEHRVEVVAEGYKPVVRIQRIMMNRWADVAIELESAPYIASEMVSIESGCFEMGSPRRECGRDDDERQHRVCVDAFAIGKYEVTFEEYDRFARETARDLPNDRGLGARKEAGD